MDYLQLLGVVAPFALAAVGTKMLLVRRDVHAVREAVDAFAKAVDDVDNAVQDPAVGETQFAQVWADFKGVVDKVKSVAKVSKQGGPQ